MYAPLVKSASELCIAMKPCYLKGLIVLDNNFCRCYVISVKTVSVSYVTC